MAGEQELPFEHLFRPSDIYRTLVPNPTPEQERAIESLEQNYRDLEDFLKKPSGGGGGAAYSLAGLYEPSGIEILTPPTNTVKVTTIETPPPVGTYNFVGSFNYQFQYTALGRYQINLTPEYSPGDGTGDIGDWFYRVDNAGDTTQVQTIAVPTTFRNVAHDFNPRLKVASAGFSLTAFRQLYVWFHGVAIPI